jgi:RND family efflux transporter MFP subunit
VVVLAGGGGGVAYALAGSSSSTGSATTTTTTVTTGTVQATVTTTGTIEPKQNEALAFVVSGTVTSVAASVGQKVSKGAVLATVDSTMLQSAVTTAQAAVTAADQQVAAVAGASATQVAAAQAQLASANTDLANAQAALASASLTAPFSGTVAAVTMAVGDVVGSSSSTGQKSSQSTSQTSTTTTDTITLISTDAWIVNASVGSSDLAQLKKGMQAQITPTGATQQVFGTVSSLGIVATSSGTGTSATFPVVIAVTGNPSGLYAGASATVNLVVKQLSNVLTVPTAAISTVNGQPVVYRIVSGQRTKTVVTLGDSYGPSTVVTKGLKDGDQVSVPLARPGGTRRIGTGGAGGAGGTGGGFGGFTRPGTTG